MFCKPDVLKPDVLKPDVLKPDFLKPDILCVYRYARNNPYGIDLKGLSHEVDLAFDEMYG